MMMNDKKIQVPRLLSQNLSMLKRIRFINVVFSIKLKLKSIVFSGDHSLLDGDEEELIILLVHTVSRPAGGGGLRPGLMKEM